MLDKSEEKIIEIIYDENGNLLESDNKYYDMVWKDGSREYWKDGKLIYIIHYITI